MKISNKLYDALKFIALVVLPLIAVFYGTLGELWPLLPYPLAISGTIMAFDALLGGIVAKLSSNYKNKK